MINKNISDYRVLAALSGATNDKGSSVLPSNSTVCFTAPEFEEFIGKVKQHILDEITNCFNEKL